MLYPIDFFAEYAQCLLAKFGHALESSRDLAAMNRSLILRLLNNFCNLVSAIAQFHVIGLLLIKLFAPLVKLIREAQLDLSQQTFWANCLRTFLFLYAQLVVSVFRGWPFSDFEIKFTALVALNLDAGWRPELESIETVEFADPRLNPFLEENESPIMDNIYSKWKPQMH
jgi:hypothetical protein